MNYIEIALRDYPETRNSDKELILKVWELQQGRVFGDSFKGWFRDKAIKAETITRARRKYQEQGEYLPSKTVSDTRYDKFKEVKGNIGITKADDVLKLL